MLQIYFEDNKNDENAWRTSLNEKEVLEILKKNKIPLGLDIAAAGFYKRKKYNYKNSLKLLCEAKQKPCHTTYSNFTRHGKATGYSTAHRHGHIS